MVCACDFPPQTPSLLLTADLNPKRELPTPTAHLLRLPGTVWPQSSHARAVLLLRELPEERQRWLDRLQLAVVCGDGQPQGFGRLWAWVLPHVGQDRGCIQKDGRGDILTSWPRGLVAPNAPMVAHAESHE